MANLPRTRICSSSIQPDDWDAMDEDMQFSERDKPTPAAASNPLSLSSVGDSPSSSELSPENEQTPGKEYREMLEHSIGIRDLKMALRHLLHMIREHEEFGDVFEEESQCHPRNVAAWSNMQDFFKKRIHEACAAVRSKTNDMEIVGCTPDGLEKLDAVGAKDEKEAVDAFMHSLRGEVEERLTCLETDPGTDDKMRHDEREWAEEYFRCAMEENH